MVDVNPHRTRAFRQRAVLLVGLLLAGCAAQLAPSYDRALVNGLTNATVDIMALFATVSSGTKPESFAQREQKYNQVIGTVDALAIQSGARPVPKGTTSEAVNKVLKERGVQPLADSEIPSATALKEISKTIAKMRDTDRKQGVTAFEAQAFRNQAVIYLDQALTYESYLER
jgi:hypothetical protein